MVVDSSALIAIFEREPDSSIYAKAMADAGLLVISSLNLFETMIVIGARRGEAGIDRLIEFIVVDNDFEIVPFDFEQALIAYEAFSRFGKGIDPKARLNLADCAAYALAASRRLPLLFKGSDFAATDILRAV